MKRKNLNLTAVLLTTFMIMYSCGTTTGKKNRVPDNDTSRIALDWQGAYSGNLPCADCDRIETELTLNDDMTYELISTYLKGLDTHADTLKGEFTWQGNNVKLKGIPENERSSLFKVEENQVRYLDLDGNVITGDLEYYYIMKKNGNPLVENKKWQIVEIFGKEIESNPENYYLIFDSKEGRASAKVNCNILNYSYKIRNEFQVRFDHGISTLMACPDDLEDEFKQVIEVADNLSTDGKYLSLNKARMAPLARFILAE